MYEADLLAQKLGLSDEQRIGIGLHVMADLAHGPLSHAHDILLKDDGKEDSHDKRAFDAFEYGGIFDVLRDRGYTDEAINNLMETEIPPWVESKSPDLCMDRWQYGVEESRLWFAGGSEDANIQEVQKMILETGNMHSVQILEDGRFAFKDIELARIYSKSYLLLSTEHWNDPVNRVQLHLLIETMKHAIVARKYEFMDDIDIGISRNPSNYSYAIDSDVDAVLMSDIDERDDFVYATRSLLRPISSQERERFIRYKQRQYAQFLTDEKATDYPSEILDQATVDFGPPSAHVRILHNGVEEPQNLNEARNNAAMVSKKNGDTKTFHLAPLKNRYVDPLVITDNGARRLSEIDKNYKKILEQQQRVQATSLDVKFFLSDIFDQHLVNGRERNGKAFEELQKSTDNLSRDQLRHQIEDAADRAEDIAMRIGLISVRSQS
jgi:hypothetical protein